MTDLLPQTLFEMKKKRKNTEVYNIEKHISNFSFTLSMQKIAFIMQKLRI